MKQQPASGASVLLAVALAALLSGCAGGIGPQVSEEFSQRLTLSGSTTIMVDSDAGSVELTAAGDGVVQVDATKRAPARDQLAAMTITATNDNGAVRITYKRERAQDSPRSVDFRIQAPAGAGLQVNTAGGSITARGFHQGLDARTGGGSVTARDVQGDLNLRAGGGSIDVSGAQGRIDAETGGGSITVSGRITGDSRVRAGGGAIAVTVPADSRLTVDAQTGGGSASNDFGLPVTGTGSCRFSGTIGDGGGGRLELRTGGGSVSLKRDG